MEQLNKPSPQLWQVIVNTHRRFMVSDLQTWVEGTYYEVLRAARERARATPDGVIIAAFHDGKWYQVDMAYSDKEHAV